MPAQHYSIITMLDHTNEKSSLRVYNGAITAVSLPGFLSEFGDLQAATDALTLGTMHSVQWVGDLDVLSQEPPANKFAQRENKLLVTYVGNTSGKLFQVTIPTINLGLLEFVPGGGDAVSITSPVEMQNWVSAFEQIARTPDSDQETVTVLRARAVGRNI